MKRPVPRAGRILDVLGALVFLAGAVVYLRAWLGMRALQGWQSPVEGPAFAAMAQFDHLWKLSRAGLWTMGAGAALAVVAALVARAIQQRRESAITEAAASLAREH